MNDVVTFMARRTLADLAANGAILCRDVDQGDGLPRAVVEYRPGADRDRCRALIAEAKAEDVWPALVRSLPLPEGAS